ncbi:dipeptidase PepV [Candidatus Phytoplasma solani]|uniref:dipeptidase PepV n=1 Tax=Candidatus Phytoplasma solani TaxID=69896 RepID=UPI0003B7D617|nr:dipeptidase PepV [Candidatus Phytoplasma solani]CCP88286.1 predicted peptidase M20 family [Candidatus Phytoplasma solani]
MIDFRQEVLQRKDALITSLQNLLKINSELTSFSPDRVGAPFGKGNQKALEYMLDLGKQSNFEVVNVDGYAGHIEYGSQKEWVCMIGHLDVVPAGSNWTYPPYEARIVDGKIFARGAEDDKGPTIAVFWALKILKELNLPLQKRIKLILGLDEETGWRCMEYYFQKFPEIPSCGFIPDSHFPVVYAEKGICVFLFERTLEDWRIISIKSGSASNVVPDFASAIIIFDPTFLILFNDFIAKNNIQATLTTSNNQIKIDVFGKLAHGSTPWQGKNALYLLIKILKALGIDNDLINLFDQYLVDDLEGKQIGIYHNDHKTGKLVCFSGVLEYINNKVSFSLNLRYPKGMTYQTIETKLTQLAQKYHFTLKADFHRPLLYVDPQSNFIQTLMQVYQKYTDDLTSKPLCVGGGTFARCAPNLVAFGPHFKGEPSLAHQKDEFMSIKNLLQLTTIYAEALYLLAK